MHETSDTKRPIADFRTGLSRIDGTRYRPFRIFKPQSELKILQSRLSFIRKAHTLATLQYNYYKYRNHERFYYDCDTLVSAHGGSRQL